MIKYRTTIFDKSEKKIVYSAINEISIDLMKSIYLVNTGIELIRAFRNQSLYEVDTITTYNLIN